MRRLSSSTTSFYKRGFPLLWLGFLQLVAASTPRSDPVADELGARVAAPHADRP